MDCGLLTMGELVGNAPHVLWSPNMHPKLLARGAPLYRTGIKRECAHNRQDMTIGLILGVTLVAAGLVLLCHHSYTSLSDKSGDAQDDIENAAVMTGKNSKRHNDCILPFCFFQVAQVTNHETWIVACLMTGATVLGLSMVSRVVPE